jgi:predicted ABC-type ATPase
LDEADREPVMPDTERKPRAVVLAGINGAGKTTASRSLLADTFKLLTFVNADVIARGLSGFDVEAAAYEASRVMLERLRALAADRTDFAFETTLAGRTYASWLRDLTASGYSAHMFYIWVRDAEFAVARVAARVQAGGHHVPADTIRQRYVRSIRNLFDLYMPLMTTWKVYDNTHDDYRLVAEGGAGWSGFVYDAATWDAIRKGAGRE